MDSVPGITVAEVVLDESQIVALVGQGEAAGMPQSVRVHARQATEYQRGRVFLAGDAAHVHSPAGGQGMNNGIQDAYNLAWKLTAVLRGDSPSALLADYTDERRTATDRIIADTDRQTRAWMANTPARITVRDAAFRLADRTGLVPRDVLAKIGVDLTDRRVRAVVGGHREQRGGQHLEPHAPGRPERGCRVDRTEQCGLALLVEDQLG